MGKTINLVNNFKVENVIFNSGEYNNLEKKLIIMYYNSYVVVEIKITELKKEYISNINLY